MLRERQSSKSLQPRVGFKFFYNMRNHDIFLQLTSYVITVSSAYASLYLTRTLPTSLDLSLAHPWEDVRFGVKDDFSERKKLIW